MAVINGNYIKIDGNGNVVVQDIDNSTININNQNSKQINDFIEELHDNSRETVNIIILSSTVQRMEALIDADNKINTEKYGNNIEEWKPFGDKTILEIMKEGAQSLRAEISVFFLETINIEDDYTWADLKYIKNRTILILDIFALHILENKFIANVFNDYHIGGCIVISPESVNERLMNIKKTVFNHHEIYLAKFKGKIGLMHFRKKCITDLGELIIEIANIAHYFLKIEFNRKINSEFQMNFRHNKMTL